MNYYAHLRKCKAELLNQWKLINIEFIMKKNKDKMRLDKTKNSIPGK